MSSATLARLVEFLEFQCFSNVLGELLVELLVVIFPLRDFREHFQALDHEALHDHAKNLLLLLLLSVAIFCLTLLPIKHRLAWLLSCFCSAFPRRYVVFSSSRHSCPRVLEPKCQRLGLGCFKPSVLGELLVELFVVIFPLRDFREHFQALDREVLRDHAKNLLLLLLLSVAIFRLIFLPIKHRLAWLLSSLALAAASSFL